MTVRVPGHNRDWRGEDDTRGMGSVHERRKPGMGTEWQPPRPARRLEPDITTEELKKVRREGRLGPASPNVGWWVPR